MVKIIGTIFGMAAFLAIIAAVLFVFRRHRKRRREDDMNIPTIHIPHVFDEPSVFDESERTSSGIRDYE